MIAVLEASVAAWLLLAFNGGAVLVTVCVYRWATRPEVRTPNEMRVAAGLPPLASWSPLGPLVPGNIAIEDTARALRFGRVAAPSLTADSP